MRQNWMLTSLNLIYAKFYNYLSFDDMIIIKSKGASLVFKKIQPWTNCYFVWRNDEATFWWF